MSNAHSQTHEIPPLAAYVCTEMGAALARDVIGASASANGALMGGGLSGAARAVGTSAGTQMFLTELDDLPVEDACHKVSALRQSGAGVIVFGEDQNIHTYRALRKAGALEYFPMPVSAQDILSIEITPSEPANLSRPVGTRQRTIGVIGTNGGAGASALAESLGHLFAAHGGDGCRTALVDADLQFGSVALDLDRSGTPGLLDALKAPERIDSTFLHATMDQVSDRLSIYSHTVDLQSDSSVARSGWLAMLEKTKADFTTTVVDLPRGLLLQDPSLLDALDAAVLVVPAGYAGVNAAVRVVSYIRSVQPDLEICLVLSEVRKDAQLSPKDIAKALGLDLGAILPRCDAHVLRAQRKGTSIVELYPRAPYAKACAEILSALAPDTNARPKRKPFFRRAVT